ncbi:MAG: lamin tail domain-containing protein [Deltaproteobacteria bacterium]|nr:lamin tail domain-containing protein [Deltaproteobacteria bacterium]MBN2670591.1 lamin tail domain-containing protein [Deltaproteobacteria bacterium]
MKQLTIFIIVWGAAFGCMDTHLLDEMELWSADSETSLPDAADIGASEETGNDAANDAPGPPDTDADDHSPPLIVGQCSPGAIRVGAVCMVSDNLAAWVAFSTDEPAHITMPESVGGAVLSSDWSTEHELLLDGSNEVVQEPVAASFGLEDVNGNAVELDVAIPVLAGCGVRITEVLADCIGDEPDGEFVEIANWGTDTIDLAGWMIDDNGDQNGDIIVEGMLASGQVAVLALDGFAPLDGLVIPLDSSIGSSGLKNSASESVELYDAGGAVVDRYENSAQLPKEGISFVRRSAKLPVGVPNLWVSHPDGGSSPGLLVE